MKIENLNKIDVNNVCQYLKSKKARENFACCKNHYYTEKCGKVYCCIRGEKIITFENKEEFEQYMIRLK